MVPIFQQVRSDAADLYARFWASDTAVLITTSAIVGIGAGFGAVVFRWLIASFEFFAFEGGGAALSFLGAYYVVLIPAFGGLIVGPLVYFFAREAKGHGVPEVMEAVALKGGRIRPIVAVVKALASSICIGTGGSVGREGPIVQIGSALGSTLGQVLRLPDERIRTLVACGAAGGIAATFNAPVAGVIFALEVILREFSSRSFSMVVIASVTSSEVGRTFLGNFPAFQAPPYSLISPWELLLYTLLGLIAAPVASAFIFLIYRMEDVFDAWRFPEYIKPAVGGLGVGIIGLFTPQVFGVGYGTIGRALHGELITEVMLGLLMTKLLATSLTLGSGGSGGIFAPSLVMGAVLGGSFGNLVHEWMPTITAPPGAYALVGMAAVFAGAARAPITAVLILFEMTQDYRIILPLMLATVVSTLLSGRLHRESIYTLKLIRRGVDIGQRRQQNLMRSIRVDAAMTPFSQLLTVRPDTSFEALAKLFQTTHSHGFAVVNEKDEIYGIVSVSDLERALKRSKATGTVRDIYTTRLITAFPEEPLEEVIQRIGVQDVSRIPVVDRVNPRRLLGMVHRADVIRAYTTALMDDQARQDQMERLRLEQATGAQLIEIDLDENDAAVDKRLGELRIPPDCLIISIRRGGRVVVPRGETEFLAGDHVVALASPGKEEMLRRCLQQGGEC
ncbi:MAG: chloride channel protein [Candidatus Binatia bacterium]